MAVIQWHACRLTDAVKSRDGRCFSVLVASDTFPESLVILHRRVDDQPSAGRLHLE